MSKKSTRLMIIVSWLCLAASVLLSGLTNEWWMFCGVPFSILMTIRQFIGFPDVRAPRWLSRLTLIEGICIAGDLLFLIFLLLCSENPKLVLMGLVLMGNDSYLFWPWLVFLILLGQLVFIWLIWCIYDDYRLFTGCVEIETDF